MEDVTREKKEKHEMSGRSTDRDKPCVLWDVATGTNEDDSSSRQDGPCCGSDIDMSDVRSRQSAGVLWSARG